MEGQEPQPQREYYRCNRANLGNIWSIIGDLVSDTSADSVTLRGYYSPSARNLSIDTETPGLAQKIFAGASIQAFEIPQQELAVPLAQDEASLGLECLRAYILHKRPELERNQAFRLATSPTGSLLWQRRHTADSETFTLSRVSLTTEVPLPIPHQPNLFRNAQLHVAHAANRDGSDSTTLRLLSIGGSVVRAEQRITFGDEPPKYSDGLSIHPSLADLSDMQARLDELTYE